MLQTKLTRIKEVSLVFGFKNLHVNDAQDTESCSDRVSNMRHVAPTISAAQTYEIQLWPRSNILFTQEEEKAILVFPI